MQGNSGRRPSSNLQVVVGCFHNVIQQAQTSIKILLCHICHFLPSTASLRLFLARCRGPNETLHRLLLRHNPNRRNLIHGWRGLLRCGSFEQRRRGYNVCISPAQVNGCSGLRTHGIIHLSPNDSQACPASSQTYGTKTCSSKLSGSIENTTILTE